MPRGIQHSRFLQWSPLDRGYALAWQRNERETCKTCGTRHDQWAGHTDDEPAFVPWHYFCPGDAALAEEQDRLPTDHDGKPLPGWRPYLVPGYLAAEVITDDM